MHSRIHAHVPYPQLAEALPYLKERGLNAEVFFSADSLDRLIPEELEAHAAYLQGAGLRTTIHSPFMDLNPGSFEPLLRDATRHRFRQVMEAAKILRPVCMVFHPGYDRWRYGSQQARWMELSLPVWRELVAEGAEIGTTICVENIFEEEPSVLKALLEGVDAPNFRHCFDVGHWNLFKTVSLEHWFAEIGSWIAETHIHDNATAADDHAPPGTGTIDFPLFFSLMERYAPQAVLTLEAHSRENLEQSLAVLPQLAGK